MVTVGGIRTELRVDARHVGELVRRLHRGLEPAVRRELRAAGSTFSAILAARTRRVGAVDTGALERGWVARAEGWQLLVVQDTSGHGLYVERGRRAGARRPPASALVPWVERRLGLHGGSARRAAWAISSAIERRGIEARRISTDARTRTQLRVAVRQAVRAAFEGASRG